MDASRAGGNRADSAVEAVQNHPNAAVAPSGPLSLRERVRVRGRRTTISFQLSHHRPLPPGDGSRSDAPAVMSNRSTQNLFRGVSSEAMLRALTELAPALPPFTPTAHYEARRVEWRIDVAASDTVAVVSQPLYSSGVPALLRACAAAFGCPWLVLDLQEGNHWDPRRGDSSREVGRQEPSPGTGGQTFTPRPRAAPRNSMTTSAAGPSGLTQPQ